MPPKLIASTDWFTVIVLCAGPRSLREMKWGKGTRGNERATFSLSDSLTMRNKRVLYKW